MTERRYTIAEINALRCCERDMYLIGRYSGPDLSSGRSVFGRSYREPELTVMVEEKVRTHMMAGLVAQDLLDSEVAAADA